jgi:hypothetical protein
VSASVRARFWEAVGARRLYDLVAKVTGDSLLPASGKAPDGWTTGRLAEVRLGSVYFGAANAARACLYIPAIVVFTQREAWPALAYTWGLVGVHALMVVVEDYKRALCDLHMPRAVEGDARPSGDPRPTNGEAWFRPKRWESTRLYEAVGVLAFQRFVDRVMTVLTHGPKAQRREYLKETTRARALEFERATRYSESVHSVAALLMLPLAAWAWMLAPVWVALLCTWFVVGDTWLVFLQRHHRLRVWPLVERLRRRA